MKDFEKYPSLVNHYREKEINYHRYNPKGYWNEENWYLTEKVDGANFQFHFDVETQEVSVGSRTRWVDGQFFNCQPVIDKYAHLVKMFAEYICGADEYVTIYGELFGGYWFGEKTNASAVLNRVSYSPDREFVAFDVVCDGMWLSRETVDKYAMFTDIPFLPVLKTGSFKELLEESPEFDSTVPELLGLDTEGRQNLSEGYVLRPMEHIFSNGKPFAIKLKSKKFSEKKERTKGSSSPEVEHPLLCKLAEYVTESRLHSVQSKIGLELTSKTFGQYLGAFLKDVWEDAVNDGVVQKDFKNIDGYKSLTKQLTGEIRKLFLPLV